MDDREPHKQWNASGCGFSKISNEIVNLARGPIVWTLELGNPEPPIEHVLDDDEP